MLVQNKKVSFEQLKLLEKIKDIVLSDKTICYPWPSDISGRYAQQYLYPKIIDLNITDINQCDYLVLDYTAGNKKYAIADQISNKDILLEGNEAGEIYQIIK